MGNEGILTLIRSKSLTGLEDLDLSDWGAWERYDDDGTVHTAGIEALAGWPGLAHIRSLRLTGNEVGREGLRALLRSKHAGALKELSLRGGRLDGQAMAEFAPPAAGQTTLPATYQATLNPALAANWA